MPSIAQSLGALETVFATEKPNAKLKPTLIMIDNVLGTQNAVIALQDRFMPSASNLVPTASLVEQLIERLRINVSSNACVSIRDELEDIEILGAMELRIVTADDACLGTVAWHYQ